MTTFRTQSKEFLRDLSRAAAWMMRRSKGQNHWWRSSVLTSANSATDKKRPIFDQARADQIFKELIDRTLLVQRADDVDGTGVPSYTMKYDIDGWDQAVADARPFYAQLVKIRRTWFLILLTFLIGCIVTIVENRVVGALDSLIDRVVGTQKDGPNKDSAANGSQPIRSQTNSTTPAAGSRR